MLRRGVRWRRTLSPCSYWVRHGTISAFESRVVTEVFSLPLLLFLKITPATAACPVSPPVLQQQVEAAHSAYEAWDWDHFNDLVDRVRTSTACLSSVPDSELVRDLHLLEALVAARRMDAVGSMYAFRGVISVDPSFRLGTELAPAGSIQSMSFDNAIAAEPAPTTSLPGGDWILDGESDTVLLPLERAVLLQRWPEGEPIGTLYLSGTDNQGELETWIHLQTEVVQVEPANAAARPRRRKAPAPGHPSWYLLAGAAGLAVLSGTCLTRAEALEGPFWDNLDDIDAARRTFRTSRALAVTGEVAGVGAVGLGLTAVVVGNW